MLLHDAFDFHGRGRGACCFARCCDRSYTYAEAVELSVALAHALRNAGVGHGDRICLIQRNSTEGLLLIFAASRIGAVIVPLNARLCAREWVDLAHDAEAACIFADADIGAEFDRAPPIQPASRPLIKICLAGSLPGWHPFSEFVGGQCGADVAGKPTEGDVVFHMYTSGTTGRPKAALLTHRAMMANIAKTNCAVPHRLNPGERTLVVLPLFHIAAISMTLCAIANGACLVIHRDVDPVDIATSLAEDEIVTTTLVPAVLRQMLAVPGIERQSFQSLRSLGYGASPISPDLLRQTIEVFHCAVAQGYGMTETGGTVTILTEDDHKRAVGAEPDLLLSAGRPLPGTQLKIVRPDGVEVPSGEIGEVLVKGADLLVGYWRDPEATEAVLEDGWLRTGDAGRLDARGYLYICDRLKDMIVTGAENVFPAEVEAVLATHPAVRDVAVVGVPDDRWGECVMAFIVADFAAGPRPADLDRLCRTKLGGFKVPKRYEFVTELPRNATGKVLKRELRDRYWRGHQREVA